MKTLNEIIGEYQAAEEAFAPYRTALRERLEAAINTYKRVSRELKLYGSDWKYDWTHWINWVNVNDVEIYGDSLTIVYDKGEYGDDEAVLTFDEIENAETHALAAAELILAQRDRNAKADKEAKRRDLERQLAALDN